MDATRVGRVRRASATGVPSSDEGRLETDRATASAERASRDEAGAVALPLDHERLERVVLVAYTFARERAAALLGGLGAREQVAAQALLASLVARPSPDRQARAAQVFGPVPEAPQRLRYLMAEASPPLQAELLRRLPPYYRSLFPSAGAPRAAPCPLALGRLAERLIREATR
jgi:hypothetical protein